MTEMRKLIQKVTHSCKANKATSKLSVVMILLSNCDKIHIQHGEPYKQHSKRDSQIYGKRGKKSWVQII